MIRVLQPIWTTKPETAARLRGRIEQILDFATVRGLRAGENPARWRGHLSKLLPAKAQVRRVEHHAALPWAEIPAFMAQLAEQPGLAAFSLRLVILTAARTGEAIGATWAEIDLDAAIWTVPARRMKAEREHRVPLSAPAVALLRELAVAGRRGPEDCVFPGGKPGRPLSNMAMLALLRRMRRDDLTAHGFRSTFRDWAAESTAFPAEVAEAALAHAVSNKVVAAYQRGDLFTKRRELMNAWATHCESVVADEGDVK